MTPELMRLIWQLIEVLPDENLTDHDPEALVNLVIEQLRINGTLKPEQSPYVRTYLRTKTTLIRDLSEQQQWASQHSLAH